MACAKAIKVDKKQTGQVLDGAMVPFFVVLARDRAHVTEKAVELTRLGVPFIVLCGENMRQPHVVYRVPIGKYDAINFVLQANLIPKNAEIVAFNDVDTKITGFSSMLQQFADSKVGIAYATELVKDGPQRNFFAVFNPVRKLFPLAASGELMLIRTELLRQILPLKPCKAEDTLIMFKALELGNKVVFCDDCFAETERTKTGQKEELYKRKTVAGIYQALSFTNPPPMVRLLYSMLPFLSIVFMVMGSDGYYTFRGILLGFLDFRRGDRSGTWKTTYME
jgi:cellulose synthase/poly-beta-1,6-N-acetylglucosamine synthase-like glycosyltransferase